MIACFVGVASQVEAGVGILGFFAQDSDNWRLLARAGGIDAVLQAALIFENSAAILEAAYGALWQLAIDDANRALIADRLDTTHVSKSVARFPREEKLKKHATGLLQLMALSEGKAMERPDMNGARADVFQPSERQSMGERVAADRMHGPGEPLVIAAVEITGAATNVSNAAATASVASGAVGTGIEAEPEIADLNAAEGAGVSFGSDIQMDTIVEAFYVFDGDDDGTITTQEFDAVMRSLYARRLLRSHILAMYPSCN